MKLLDQRIEKDDIEGYLNSYSDFSFEVKVLKIFTSLGFDCEHSGTYEDPITKKTREFDIRAWNIFNLNENTTFRLGMAVECKNIRENFPLVVHCMPRTEGEAYHHIVWSHMPSDPYMLPAFFKYGQRVRLGKNETVYAVGEPVGKSCDQVGRRASQSGEIIGSDSDVFDKISQSLNSTYEILRSSHYAGDRESTVISFILPVLVVPNGRIWVVSYDIDGNITEGPNIVSRIPYYIDKSWEIGGDSQELAVWYYMSHLEIVEIDYINELIEIHTKNERYSLKNLHGYLLNTIEQERNNT